MAQSDAPAAASLLPADIETHIKALLEGQDLTTLSLKEVRTRLETKLGKPAGSLDVAKAELKVLVAAEMKRIQEAAESSSSSSSDEAKKPGAESKQGTKRSAEPDPQPTKKKGRQSKGAPVSKKQGSLMSRKEFMEKAKGCTVNIGNTEVQVPPKAYSTGSSGFYANTKVTLMVAGVPLSLQCQITLTTIGSKQWEDE